MSYPPCPECDSEFAYQDQNHLVCPECGYEWNPNLDEDTLTTKDAHGAFLESGDKVILIKDLKVKGSSLVLKVGTKAIVRRISEGKNHQLDCKIVGGGEIMITAKFVKKA